jgi:HEAT repeat protein
LRYAPAMRNRLSAAGFVALALLGGCDTISSDFEQFSESFVPPTPAQAAQWAADPNDMENARRGTVLLASAPWGGALPYLRMYRLYAEDARDPLLRAAAIQALGRHGDPEDAVLVATNLVSPFRQVRLASARALQRLHDPSVADTLWPRLVDGAEDADVRTEIAVALGQYPTPAVFRALVAALAQRDLAVNAAAIDSLRSMTGQDIGLDEDAWLAYFASSSAPFASARVYLYPVFVRELDIWDHLMFWNPVVFERADVPVGLKVFGARRTNDAAREAADPVAGEGIELPGQPESGAAAESGSAASSGTPAKAGSATEPSSRDR